MRYIISFAFATLTAAPLRAEVPVVVADIPPVHALVSQVMGDLGAPVLLADRGADAHDMSLRPSQARALAGAGLLVWIGPEMSPWLDRALEGTETAAASLPLLGVPGTELRDYADVEEDHGAEGAHGHGDNDHDAKAGHTHDEHAHDEHGHKEHGHVRSGTDPHAWLDPANAALWLDAIAAELGRIDPDNSADYAANAAAAAAGIAALDAEIAALLAPVRDRPVIVFHDAYGYFAGHYGVTVAAAIAGGGAADPGAARVRAVQEKAGQVACIFPEANHSSDLPAQIAEAADARLGAPLDPEGATLDPGPGLYDTMMRGLARSLAECLADG
jgi:zinc transport system substrate-binding protein